MPIDDIYLGVTDNDGLGDDAKTAGQKINANFNYLDGLITPSYELVDFGSEAINNTAGTQTTATEIVATINAGGFTVSAGKLIKLQLTTIEVINGASSWVRYLYDFKQNNVKGTWGTGSTNGVIAYTDLIIRNRTVLTSGFAPASESIVIPLGFIGSDPIEDYLNGLADDTHNLLNDGTSYYFDCNIAGEQQTYQYVGALPVDFGQDTSTALDFDLIASAETVLNNGLPSGGTTGQILKKQSATDFDADWEDETSVLATPIPYGIIYKKDTWTDTTDFNLNGNSTAVLSGDKINIGTTTVGSHNNYVSIGNPTGLSKWKITMDINVINTLTSTSYGLGIGIRSLIDIPANAYQIACRVDMSSNATKGMLLIDYGSPSFVNIVTSGSDRFNFVKDDDIRFIVEQDLDVLTVTMFNITTNALLTRSYTYTLPLSPFPSNTGNFAIYNLGGTYELNSLKIESKEWKDSKLMCIGDSKTNGYSGDSFNLSFPQQLETYYRGISDSSGGNDTTNEVLLKIPEIISFAPKKVLLNIGSNDKRYGYTFTEWKDNYHDIVDQLELSGIDVYHLLQLNESVLSFTDYNDEIILVYPSDRIIDAGIIPLTAGGVHPNQTAMDQIFMSIVSDMNTVII